MAARVTGNTSDDSHLAGRAASLEDESSDGQHLAEAYSSADGSFVNDGEYVYVLPLKQIRQVDYFHGTIPGLGPVAQMMDDEVDILASEMFSTRPDGRTVRAIITLQRRWRGKKLLAGGSSQMTARKCMRVGRSPTDAPLPEPL